MGVQIGLIKWDAGIYFYVGSAGHALGFDVCVSAASEESVWQAGFGAGQLVCDVSWRVVVAGYVLWFISGLLTKNQLGERNTV